MATNIGLNVIEVDGTASAPIQGAAVSVGAFNVLTRRGVPNRPARVTSFTDFTDRFGGFDSGSFGAYLVKGFFDNGGQRAYVNRVAGTGANAPTTASATIRQGTAANSPALLTLEGGFRGQPDPGTWSEGIQATLTPSFASGLKGAATIAKDGTTLDRVAGFAVGDTVLVQDGAHRAIVTVAQLNPATGEVKWTPDLAGPGDFTAATDGLVDRLRPGDHTAGRGTAGGDVDAPDARPRRRELRRHDAQRPRPRLEARPGDRPEGGERADRPRHAGCGDDRHPRRRRGRRGGRERLHRRRERPYGVPGLRPARRPARLHASGATPRS